MFTNFWRWLNDERGQVAVDPASPPSDPVTEPAAPAAEPAPAGDPSSPPAPQEAFFDPSQVPPELQPTWKQMQASYTKKMQQAAQYREARDLVQRFHSDPEYARQTIMARAQQLGMQLGQPATSGTSVPAGAPTDMVEAVKARWQQKHPELTFMAPAVADAFQAMIGPALSSLQQQQASSSQAARDQEYERIAAALSEKMPGWEQHEEEMNSLLAFFQSNRLSDRQWGSKLELLLRLVTGDGQATAEAARRLAQAARSRVSVGQPTATPVPNIAEQVRKPRNMQDAWDVAAKFAMEEARRNGQQVA